MAKIKVDGKEMEAPAGASLLQALLDRGIFVPHFCYHPDLPVDGNCRQCLVELETPKGVAGVISCATRVAEGMVVRTQTPTMEKARRGVLEFLLVNHPVDCPVCDQAGECRLQQYYMTYGFHQSRVTVEKVHKNKTLRIGPRVILDQERCVLCSRCVRFTRHVTKTSELAIGGRGDHSFITTFPGQPLANKYSVCTVDVCPVGALTDLDFRFQCRVWFLKPTDTICHGCARGCNAVLDTYSHTTMDGLQGTAYRLRPRRNPEVNKSWMCDEGRLLYREVNENRLREPELRLEGGARPAAWEEALDSVVEKVKAAGPAAVAGLCSPDGTNEDLFLFRKLMVESVGTELVSAESWRQPGYEDDILLRADKHPNSLGAQFLGPWKGLQEILSGIESGRVQVLIVLHNDFLGMAGDGPAVRAKLNTLKTLVVLDSRRNPTVDAAHVVLPTGSFAEREGTYVNFQGRVQRAARAVLPRWGAKSETEILRGLAEKLGRPLEGLSNAMRIWEHLASSVPALAGITYQEIGKMGCWARGYGPAAATAAPAAAAAAQTKPVASS
ncbi:MAG: molybdopterin-dependent oxidoreductase [Planctomycetes bacterium]|nr:molybdopterin-dependent oxidoreductase [Planctomycetota bacterium]